MFTVWDEVKAASNSSKHGVFFDEAASVFEDYFALTYPDTEHALHEERFIILGVSSTDKILIDINTQRIDTTRTISVPKATSKERRFHEQQF